jgi:DNA-binding LacI/PurR family transcriptional regulator
MVTIKDISKKCGVSPATVSKALNGYDDISEETIRLVRQTASELNYTPNAAARLLKTSISHNIGVLFVDDTMSGLTHEYFSYILNSVKEEAEISGYDITFISQKLGKRKMSFLQHCLYRNCDGVVIASVNFDSKAVHELINSDVPVVTIDYAFDNVSSVLSDNVEGAYELTSYLLNMGHRKIGYIFGEQTSVTNKRLVGFNKALKEHGVSIPPEYMVQGRYHDAEVVREATAKLMDLPDPPTAIMFPDDISFLGGQAELTRRGLRIPEDISVCGYDGINLSGLLQPPLTTWHQDADRIGKESVRKLIETIEHRSTCAAEQIMVSGQLVSGSSVREWDEKM